MQHTVLFTYVVGQIEEIVQYFPQCGWDHPGLNILPTCYLKLAYCFYYNKEYCKEKIYNDVFPKTQDF